MQNKLNEILEKLDNLSDKDDPKPFYEQLEEFRVLLSELSDEQKIEMLPVAFTRIKEIVSKLQDKKDFIEEYLSIQISNNNANNAYGRFQE